MSTPHRRRWIIPALVAWLGVGWSLEARADKVDWSQYLEPAGSRPAPKQVASSGEPATAQRAPTTRATRHAKAQAQGKKKPARKAASRKHAKAKRKH